MKSSNGSSPKDSESTVQLLSSSEDLSDNEYHNKLNIFGCIGEILKFDEAENRQVAKMIKGYKRYFTCDICPMFMFLCMISLKIKMI